MTANTCHECSKPAVVQWQRDATPEEAAAHWDTFETDVRTRVPEYVHNREDTVRISVFGCADHGEPDA